MLPQAEQAHTAGDRVSSVIYNQANRMYHAPAVDAA
jgi:hypothetical protein